jgi:hypothetical protein
MIGLLIVGFIVGLPAWLAYLEHVEEMERIKHRKECEGDCEL